jgi:hypothetical protein
MSPTFDCSETADIYPAALTTTKGSTGCLHRPLSPRSFIAWIPLLLFETFLMFLMLIKGWCTYKSGTGSKLFHLIIIDRFGPLDYLVCACTDITINI